MIRGLDLATLAEALPQRGMDHIRDAIEPCRKDTQAHAEVIPDLSRVLVGSIVAG